MAISSSDSNVYTPVETVETRANEEKKTPEAVVEAPPATETQETTQQPAENAPVETASQPEAGASSEVVSEGAHEQASVQMETPVTQVEGESVTAKEEPAIETKVETQVEPAITKEEAERILSRLPSEKSFRFYVSLGQPTGTWASSLKEFCDLIEIVDVKSVEFHTFRNDFENWFRDALSYPKLAEEIARIREAGISGGELREQIYKVAKNHYDKLNRVIEETLEVVTQPAEQVTQPVETVKEETKAQPSQEGTTPAPETTSEQQASAKEETTAETASPLPTEEQPITVKIVTIEETAQETPSSLGEPIPPDQTLVVEKPTIVPQVEKPAETVTLEQPQTTSHTVSDIEPQHTATPTRPTNCHKCGAQIDTSKKQWTFESRKTHMKFLIYLYKCPACGSSFRESVKEETAPTVQVA